MKNTMRLWLFTLLAIGFLSVTVPAQAQQTTMTFFVTSAGLGKGRPRRPRWPDRHCKALAQRWGG